MKKCAYCKRANKNDAFRCCDCGTIDFEPVEIELDPIQSEPTSVDGFFPNAAISESKLATSNTFRICEFCGKKGACKDYRCADCGTVFTELAGNWQEGLYCPHCVGPIRLQQGDGRPHAVGMLAHIFLGHAGSLISLAITQGRGRAAFYECLQCGPIPPDQFPELIRRQQRFLKFVFIPGMIGIIAFFVSITIIMSR